MKYVLTTLLVLSSSNVLGDGQISVVGIPRINSAGIITIRECNTGKIYTIGTMASTPYFKLSNTINDLSKTGSVLLTARGEVYEGERNYLKYPEVIAITQGKCGEPIT